MNLKLSGRKAIITGGTRGIGRAIAETLAAEGVDIAICARKQNEIDEATASLRVKGVNAIGRRLDIANGDALKSWIAEAGEALGGIDILVPNASAVAEGNSEAAWNLAFEIDILGVVRATSAAMPFLEKSATKSGDAAIVIISSIAAIMAQGANAYGAMKAAQIHLAKGLAYEHASKNIRVNLVSPGIVYFKGGVWETHEQNSPDMFKYVLAASPTGRMATAQEIANSVVFLASSASSFTTGSNLIVDGAFTTRVNF